MNEAALAIGDEVEKFGGRYGGPGRIVSVSEDLGDGYRLYGVAHRIEGGFGEFIHVYPARALRPLNPERNLP